MFGNVKNYSDLCWRKDCLGDARHLTDWDIRIRIRIPTHTRIRIPVLPIIPPAPRTVSRSTITAAADAAERG